MEIESKDYKTQDLEIDEINLGTSDIETVVPLNLENVNLDIGYQGVGILKITQDVSHLNNGINTIHIFLTDGTLYSVTVKNGSGANLTNEDIVSIVRIVTEQIQETLKNKVDKVTGKLLSTEDFTTALKSKLEGMSIPTKVSAFENDKNYLTQHLDISGKADKLDTYTKALVDGFIASAGKVKSVNSQTGDVVITAESLGALTEHLSLDGKVDKVQGKGLSTEDFTTALKTKLESFSNYDDTALLASITSLLNTVNALTRVEDTTEIIDTLQEIINFLDSYKNTDNLASILQTLLLTIQTWVENKNYLTSHLSLAEYVKSSALATVATTGSYNDLTNKPTIPTSISDLTSDIYLPFNNTYVSDCNAWLTNGYIKVSQNASRNWPTECTGSDRWGILFFIAENAANGTGTQMYFPIDGTYKGRVFVRSLTNMKVNNTSVGPWQLLATSSELNNKVDKVSGKGLSTNDFTTTLKSKLDGLSNYDDTEVRGLITSIQNALDALTNTEDTTEAIDTLNEIITFLNQYKNTDSLASILSALESTIHTWVEGKGYLTQHQDISSKANDNSVVHLIKEETISGKKNFTAGTEGSNPSITAKFGVVTGGTDVTTYSGMQSYRKCASDNNYINTAAFIVNSDGRAKFVHRRGSTSAIGPNDDAYIAFDATGAKISYSGTKGTDTKTEYTLLDSNNISNYLPTVPNKVSELINDSGYLTEHQDISGKQDKNTLATDVKNIIDADYIKSLIEDGDSESY